MKALLSMSPHLPAHFFSAGALDTLDTLVDRPPRAITSFDEVEPSTLESIEVLITSWGSPRVDVAALDRMPSLRAVVHAAGTVQFIAEEAWRRGVVVSTAAAANAVPVAEFTVAMVVLAGKDALWIARDYSARQTFIDREVEYPHIGNYGRTVGVVGASRIGARVLELLKPYAVRTRLYDPFCSRERAAALGTELVDDLHELARRSSILTVHAPHKPKTEGLISRSVLAALPDGATVINTARAPIIDQPALLSELESGRLRAILDVTTPEPPLQGDRLYTLPNVFLTPHLAGAAGNELQRLGDSAIRELARFVRGEPLHHEVTLAQLALMA
jgi:phosphoglycerate dehydrogenase-like enzyme